MISSPGMSEHNLVLTARLVQVMLTNQAVSDPVLHGVRQKQKYESISDDFQQFKTVAGDPSVQHSAAIA